MQSIDPQALEQWAQSHETDIDVTRAIFEICMDDDDAERVWNNPNTPEIMQIAEILGNDIAHFIDKRWGGTTSFMHFYADACHELGITGPPPKGAHALMGTLDLLRSIEARIHAPCLVSISMDSTGTTELCIHYMRRPGATMSFEFRKPLDVDLNDRHDINVGTQIDNVCTELNEQLPK